MLSARSWWIRLLSEDGADGAGAASFDVFDDGESQAPQGDETPADAKPENAGTDEAAGAAFNPDDAAKTAESDLEKAADVEDDPFAELDESEAKDEDDVSDLLDDGEAAPSDDAKAEPDAKPDAQAETKDEAKPDSKGTEPDATANPYADLDAFGYAEKAPKVLAKELADIEKLLDPDMEAQALRPEGFGAWAKKLTETVRALATRAEMTDGMLARDLAAAKAAGQKQTEETLDTAIDRVALAIAGESAIGKVGSISKAQKASRQAIMLEADAIVERQKAKGVDVKALTLDRVIKAAAINLYRDRATPAAPSKATPTAKKPLTASVKPAAAPATPTNAAAPSRTSRPRTTAEAEDAVFGVRR